MKQYLLTVARLLVLLVLLAVPPVYAQQEPDPPPQPEPVPTATAAPPALAPGGFIRAEGTQLTRLGQPVTIKGVNYYPRGRPWAEMWWAWDGPQQARELRRARDELGINAVRILLPYNLDRDLAILRLREFVTIVGDLDMRVIVTLFDFHDHFPGPGSAEEARHIRYLEDLIGNFAGDDRILAWDLHNEPDHYQTWIRGDAQQVLSWLGRMADQVRRLAPNHLITIGMGQYDNLWQPGPDGRRPIDYSDVVSVHIYNAPDAARQLDELRTYTDKPILLQEFGWPSGPGCINLSYREETQEWVYRTVLQAAEGRVAGVFAWTLYDYHAGPTLRWDTREEHYGLYRPNDTLKPAAEAFRELPGPPLPSQTRSPLGLTVGGIEPPGGKFAPVPVAGTPFYVKGWFRVAWQELGGRGMFGQPLGEAFLHPDGTRVLQYFEAGVLEYQTDNGRDPAFSDLAEVERAVRMLRPQEVGLAATAGRNFPRPPEPPPGSRLFPETGYSIQGAFRRFYEGGRGEWRLGAPISQELFEDRQGRPTLVQYFERGSLERNPETHVIQYGQLGSWAFQVRCQAAPEPQEQSTGEG